MMTSVMSYIEDPDCLAHDRITEWVDSPPEFETLADVLAHVEATTDRGVLTVYFSDDLITVDPCLQCGTGDRVVGLRPLLTLGVGRCADCGSERPMESRTALAPDDPLTGYPWPSWQWPYEEAVALATHDGVVHMVLGGSHG